VLERSLLRLEKTIERLGGLIKLMPKSAILFLIACLAIAALPPLNGFVSEWLLFQGICSLPRFLSGGWVVVAPGGGRCLCPQRQLWARLVYPAVFMAFPF